MRLSTGRISVGFGWPSSVNFALVIWFWSTFNRNPRVNYDVSWRYKVSKFVKLGSKIGKIKVIGIYTANYGFLDVFDQK